MCIRDRPYGVSYNSYLIDDEMVALVDTVDVCYFEVYLKKIRSIGLERGGRHLELPRCGDERKPCFL